LLFYSAFLLEEISSVKMLKGYMVRQMLGTPALNRCISVLQATYQRNHFN